MQNSPIKIRLEIDNSKCKKLADGTKLRMHRTIKCMAKTNSGETKEYEDQQVVSEGEFKLNVAAKEPAVKFEEFQI